jgi:MFS family permease
MYTLLDKRGEPLQRLMNFCVVVPVFLAMGFSLSFFGGITGYHSVYTQFPQINVSTTHGEIRTHNSLIKGTTVASLNLGATLGCLSTMYFGNKFGRRYTILMGGLIGVAGTVLQCAAFSLAQLIVSRSKYPTLLLLNGSRSRSGSWYDDLDGTCMAIRDFESDEARSSRHC